MMIKICGITNEEDALAAADAGATAIGFNFYPKSPRYITPEIAAGIGRTLGLLRVGVFVDESVEFLNSSAQLARLDVAQLHGQEPASSIPQGLRTWKAFCVSSEWQPSEAEAYAVEAVLLDGPMPGTGQTFDWNLAKALTQRVILAGGLGPENVREAICAVRPWGVDACSKLERQPGIKDNDKVRRFVQAALAEHL